MKPLGTSFLPLERVAKVDRADTSSRKYSSEDLTFRTCAVADLCRKLHGRTVHRCFGQPRGLYLWGLNVTKRRWPNKVLLATAESNYKVEWYNVTRHTRYTSCNDPVGLVLTPIFFCLQICTVLHPLNVIRSPKGTISMNASSLRILINTYNALLR